MKIYKALIAIPLAFGLSGCVIISGDGGDWDEHSSISNWESKQKTNRTNITKLTIGLDHVTVLTRMGDPDISEAFTGSNDKAYQILFYRTHKLHGDGDTTKDETTPLVFEDGVLIGWGNDALQRTQ